MGDSALMSMYWELKDRVQDLGLRSAGQGKESLSRSLRKALFFSLGGQEV